MKCPSFERLIDYLDGRLAGGEADLVAAHLASGCQQCAPTRDWYAGLRELVASDDSIEPPSWVLKRAVRIFDEKASRRNLVERLGSAVASLVFDSFARPALMGVRSTETANRQLLYRAGDYSIDLQIAPSGSARVDVRGQVLREGEERFDSVAGLKIELGRGDNRSRGTLTGETGEFAFESVETGDYDLHLETEALSITAYGLPLKPSM
ncbi:MAG TPA: zf-HC2 domain-containing protein [Blastocatellia bacterium]|nr:zf-HC2 domain-containing protein [Blastocatellia bacterium]